ncbi:uncharacterized protein LOC121749390 [Salvia splendens]|uniref:uncharacterized protein LOC121749390 n=1 Tax=Salvia splendens TaxID=180675 RepID=UPI001C26D072|nr:uncharacterized protein LOC121749390 [Salvia splendens]
MIITTWNIRGLQQPSKQAAIVDFVKAYGIDILGILETKMDPDNLKYFLRNYFPDWKSANNFQVISNGRMLLMWNPAKADVDPIMVEAQTINVKIRCMLSNNYFIFSLVYGLYSPTDRLSMWDSLIEFISEDQPALVSGNLNCVMSPDERMGDRVATEYEMKDSIDTCTLLGLDDVPYSGCKFTWTNGTGFSKIDRVLANEAWHDNRFMASTIFRPSGALSDHSSAITTLFGDMLSFPKSFKFFNFWTNHPAYDPLVKEKWPINVSGTAQFVCAERGKALKFHLKEFNFKEASLISKRAKEAAFELEKMQLQLDPDTANLRLREEIKILRQEADD